MWSQSNGGLSATTQVKVLSPEIIIIARGQRFHVLEASNALCVIGEHDSGVPGSKSVAGNRTVYIGTWESRIASRLRFQQAEEARRKFGSTAVGLIHSRGVTGVTSCAFWTSGILEGISGITQGAEVAYAIH